MNTPIRARAIARWGVLVAVLIAGQLSLADDRSLQARGTTEDLPTQRSELAFEVQSSGPDDGRTDALLVSGWSEAELAALTDLGSWADLLQVRIDLPGQDSAALPAIVGDYVVEADAAGVSFVPRYGWSPGNSYVATLRLPPASGASEAEVISRSFYVPPADVPQELTTVTGIYPTADELPENLLRFYVEFSQPMARGAVYDAIHLIGPDGTVVEAPFLRIGQEFWDHSMRRLTIMLDPGRIKRGVGGNAQVGPPLEAGARYQLMIGAGLTDAYRRPLAGPVSKAFTVVAADRQSPEPARWQVGAPTVGTRDALTVQLDGAIDPISAQRLIRLEDADGQPVRAAITVLDRERTLHLTPERAWSSQTYRLAVHPTLEDFAGNRVESLFDMAAGTVAELAATADQRQAVYVDVAPQ